MRSLAPLLLVAACAGPTVTVAPPPSSVALAPSASVAAPEEPARQPHRVTPGELVVLVVDRSGSMSGVPMEMAKEALRAAPDACPTCRIDVIVFDSTPQHVATYQPGGARDKYEASVRKLQPGGGTDGVPALRAATKLIAKEPKGGHVVFFTDGQFAIDELGPALTELRAASGTLTTIGLGGVDARTLQRMAAVGRGRFHRVRDADKLPAVFRAELSGE